MYTLNLIKLKILIVLTLLPFLKKKIVLQFILHFVDVIKLRYFVVWCHIYLIKFEFLFFASNILRAVTIALL